MYVCNECMYVKLMNVFIYVCNRMNVIDGTIVRGVMDVRDVRDVMDVKGVIGVRV